MDGFTPYGFADTLRLYTRGCVECPDVSPTCPVCPDGQWCTQVKASCSACAYRICQAVDNSGAVNTGSNVPQSKGVNVGAIAGGVAGGVVFIALLAFVLWRFCLKGRRQRHQEWIEEEKERDSQWMQRANARASTHTVGSLASTVMTRASNVIQIAFIPGIEGRRNEDEAPPVPSIPMHTHDPLSPTTPSSPYHDNPHNSLQSSQQDHYFLPRGSTYSGFTDGSSLRYSTAQSITPSLATRNSMAPSISPSLARQSVASTIYGDSNATLGPAQTAFRGRANVVSVKPGSSNGPGGSTVPAMPAIDLSRYEQRETQPQHATSMPVLKVNGATVVDDSADENSITSSPASKIGSPSNSMGASSPRQSDQIAAQIQAAARKASQQPEHSGLGGLKRDPSPFSDDNAVGSPKLE